MTKDLSIYPECLEVETLGGSLVLLLGSNFILLETMYSEDQFWNPICEISLILSLLFYKMRAIVSEYQEIFTIHDTSKL